MRNQEGKWIAAVGLVAALVFAAPGPLAAAGFLPIDVGYSADRVVSTGGTTVADKVYYSPGKERTERSGGEQVTIRRFDKKVEWTLIPKEKAYMENRFGESKARRAGDGEYRDCDVRQADAGDEVVNGVRAKKRTVDIGCPGKSSFRGTIWVTKENIPVRMETVDKADPSGKRVFRMDLQNLRIGRQDAAIFEVPGDYRKFDMPSFRDEDLKKMMQPPQVAPTAPPKPRPSAAPADTGRSYTALPRAAEVLDGGAARGTGRAPDAEGSPSGNVGRSYTAQPREKSAIDQVLDPAKKLKGLLRW
jgi:hypothetical protein